MTSYFFRKYFKFKKLLTRQKTHLSFKEKKNQSFFRKENIFSTIFVFSKKETIFRKKAKMG